MLLFFLMKVIFYYRYLESQAYTINHRANRIVISEFGTVGVPDPCLSLYEKFTTIFIPTLRKRGTDNCFVNVLQVKDELLAMTEMNQVRIVDPATLNTKPEKVLFCSAPTVTVST